MPDLYTISFNDDPDLPPIEVVSVADESGVGAQRNGGSRTGFSVSDEKWRAHDPASRAYAVRKLGLRDATEGPNRPTPLIVSTRHIPSGELRNELAAYEDEQAPAPSMLTVRRLEEQEWPETIEIPKDPNQTADDVWRQLGGWITPDHHKECGFGPIRRLAAGLSSFHQRGFCARNISLRGSNCKMVSTAGVWSDRKWELRGQLDGWRLQKPEFRVHSKYDASIHTTFTGPGLSALLGDRMGMILAICGARAAREGMLFESQPRSLDLYNDVQNPKFLKEAFAELVVDGFKINPLFEDSEEYHSIHGGPTAEFRREGLPLIVLLDDSYGRGWLDVAGPQARSRNGEEVQQILDVFREVGTSYVAKESPRREQETASDSLQLGL